MKIIISNKCIEHMEVHSLDFIVEWRDLIKRAEHILTEEDCIKEIFMIKELDMKTAIGYDKLVKLQDTDGVVYAKRIHRTGYTRFVKNKQAALTDKMVIVLSQNRNNPNAYYLVTAYPGKICCKEPQDPHISTNQELMACLDFWKQHALIFEEESIDTSTIKEECPYEN